LKQVFEKPDNSGQSFGIKRILDSKKHFLTGFTELTGLAGLGQEDCGAAAVAGNE
jgi:hypothetical protein